MTVVPDTTWLLGAGASSDAGVPLAAEMFDALKGASGNVDLNAAYDYIAAGVIMKAARLSLLGNWRRPNIEDVANTLDALIGRDSSDIGPFVGAWHAWLNDVDPLGEPRLRVIEDVASALQRMIERNGAPPGPSTGVDWTAEAKRLVLSLHAPRYPGEILLRLRRWLSRQVSERAARPYRDTGYLAPLAGTRIGATSTCAGATLNYDLCVEEAFLASGVKTCDGLAHWLRGEVMDAEHGVAHIYKPHGSVLWRASDEDTYGVAGITDAAGEGEPGIIFGGRNKLTAHGPFLDSLLTWRAALENCKNLLIVGYSFGDDHVNALISNWFRRGRKGKRIIVVDPDFTKGGATITEMLYRRSNEALAPDTDELGNIVPPGGGSVCIVRQPAADGIPTALARLA